MAANCGICGGAARAVWPRFPGYQAPARFTIMHCAACDASFADPASVPPDIYQHIYRQAATMPGYSRYAAYAALAAQLPDPLSHLAGAEDIYWSVHRRLARTVPSPAFRILEIGSGLGYLTFSIARRGYSIRGLELSEVAVRAATERYGDLFHCGDLFEFVAVHPRAFDLVLMTEVLEHLPAPKPFLAAAARLLAPGGELLVTTPNKSAFAPNACWHGDAPPVHLWWFSERAMTRLAAAAGLQATFEDFTEYNRAVAGRLPPFLPTANRAPILDAAGRFIPDPRRSLAMRAARRLLGLNRQRSLDGASLAGSSFPATPDERARRRETMSVLLRRAPGPE